MRFDEEWCKLDKTQRRLAVTLLCFHLSLLNVAMTHGGKISTQEMMDNQVPLHVRDDCAGILIPLNKYVCKQGFL